MTKMVVQLIPYLTMKPHRTANPTWGNIFECPFKIQSSKLEYLFSLKRGKRDARALSFELSKMTPQVGLATIGPTLDDEAPGPYMTIPQYWFNKTKQHTHYMCMRLPFIP